MAVAEGKKFDFQGVENIHTDYLETFPFDETKELIRITTEEFSAVCPFSGLPDIAKVVIEYKPKGKLCLELKALKYYFNSFRQVGIYQEAVTKRIYEDLKKTLNTDSISVETFYNTRGGLDTYCILGAI